MANEFDELEQDGLFDLDDFVEKSARNEYVLLVGSEVMLEPEADPSGDSLVCLTKLFSAYLMERRKLAAVYERLDDIPMDADTLRRDFTVFLNKHYTYRTESVSRSLRRLIGTGCFRMVLTTTVDSYLELLMEEVWGKGNVDVVNIYDANSLKRFADALRDAEDNVTSFQRPVLFYVFGKAQSARQYVAKDVDAIDTISKWIRADDQISIIKKKIAEKSFLALGCKLEDWHFRFFWHMLKPVRADKRIQNAIAISSFRSGKESDCALRNYLYNSQFVYTRPDVQAFIDECADAFTLQDDSDGNPLRQLIMDNRKPDIFISYAHDDFYLAYNIFLRLNGEGFSVWIDHKDLHTADDYKKEIGKAVNRCRIFMPVLTANVARRLESGEWNFLVDEEWKAFCQRQNIAGAAGRVPVFALTDYGYNLSGEAHKRFETLMGEHTVFDMAQSPFEDLINDLKRIRK